ncbi:MAG TPA: nickel-binding protein [Micromonosporaceae bacterium]|nr:nickel-binding protein [Micromonosporaceae bacterium]
MEQIPTLRREVNMPSYLVEVYLPRSRAAEVGATGQRARAAAEQLAREGVPIRYVRTTYLPDDETCFHVFEAPTAGAVEEASRRAALGRARVVPAQEQA